VFLVGPEQDMAVTADAMAGRYWHTTGIGFGMRGATNEEIIKKFEGHSSKTSAAFTGIGFD
jgi:hypothetical protein